MKNFLKGSFVSDEVARLKEQRIETIPAGLSLIQQRFLHLRYNILYHIEYLYVFTLKLLFIRCPFAPELTRPTSLSCSFCDKQLASSVLLLSQNSRAFSQMTVTHHHHRYCQCHSHQQFKRILISEGCALSVVTTRSRLVNLDSDRFRFFRSCL